MSTMLLSLDKGNSNDFEIILQAAIRAAQHIGIKVNGSEFVDRIASLCGCNKECGCKDNARELHRVDL